MQLPEIEHGAELTLNYDYARSTTRKCAKLRANCSYAKSADGINAIASLVRRALTGNGVACPTLASCRVRVQRVISS